VNLEAVVPIVVTADAAEEEIRREA